jgi:hypothetical protein
MDRYFYIVEESNGRKEIHFSGNIYYNDGDETDKCFRLAEWTGFFITVDKLKELLESGEFFDYINEKVGYLGDLTEDEAVEACQVYFNGEPGKWLNIKHVNENTPCGDYWFE